MKTTRELLVFPASDREYPNRPNNVVSSAKKNPPSETAGV
jgi:hypothetical protein